MPAVAEGSWFDTWRQRLGVPIVVAVIILLSLVVIFNEEILVTIDAGHVGVLWSRFQGTITDRTYGEGMHAIFPWNHMTQYSIRFQTIEASFVSMSEDGLAIESTIVTRFKPTPESIAMLHKTVGPDFVEVLIKPEIAAAAREAIAKMSPDDLYSEQRGEIQDLITKKVSRGLGLPPELVETEILEQVLDLEALAAAERPGRDPGDSDDPKDRARKRRKKIGKTFSKDGDTELVNVDEVLMGNVALPKSVGGAIEHKLAEQQAHLEYVYRLQREAKERQRRIIEAEGIAEFQRITGGLSLLRWKGMDATLQLGFSPNSQLVLVGNRETGGLPLVLGPLVPGEASIPPPELLSIPPAPRQAP